MLEPLGCTGKVREGVGVAEKDEADAREKDEASEGEEDDVVRASGAEDGVCDEGSGEGGSCGGEVEEAKDLGKSGVAVLFCEDGGERDEHDAKEDGVRGEEDEKHKLDGVGRGGSGGDGEEADDDKGEAPEEVDGAQKGGCAAYSLAVEDVVDRAASECGDDVKVGKHGENLSAKRL